MSSSSVSFSLVPRLPRNMDEAIIILSITSLYFGCVNDVFVKKNLHIHRVNILELGSQSYIFLVPKFENMSFQYPDSCPQVAQIIPYQGRCLSERSKVEKMATFSGGGKDGSRAVGDRGVPLQAVADQLLLEVRRETQETGHISDDLMSALNFLFHQSLLQALDLIDRKHVSHFVCPSGRELYRVQGSRERTYTCLVSSNYCSCPSFVYTVLVREDSLMCKHMLAVQLARAMAAAREVTVSDEEFTELLGTDRQSEGTAHDFTMTLH